MSRTIVVLAWVLACVLGDFALAESRPLQRRPPVVVRNSGSLKLAASRATPGTVILVAPGNYEPEVWIKGVTGAEGVPVIIAAQDPGRKPVFEGGRECFKLSNASHVELRNLVFVNPRDNALNIDDGANHDKPSVDIVITGIEVRSNLRKGNHDGIKLSGVHRFLVRDCTIDGWGKDGSAIDMVGCRDGLIENCKFTDPTGKTATGPQAKGGSQNITFRRCRFETAGLRALNLGGRTSDSAFRMPPNEEKMFEARNMTVEGCTFIGSEAPLAFVGVDGAEVRYNTFYHPGRWVMRILQESRGEDFITCRNGNFHHNLVVTSDSLNSTVNVGKLTAPETFKFSDNWWYCDTAPGMSAPTLPTTETNGVIGKDPLFVNAKSGDLNVSAESPAKSVGAHALPPEK